jgi:para-aminobenzoate synthetase / 4-amino-4-deoxychorismate lyase
MNDPLPSSPFVLLDDARASGAATARLYRDPVEVIQAQTADDVTVQLERLREGNWAGFICYEAGATLEPKLAGQFRAPALPLLWFGRFEGYEALDGEQVASFLPDAAGGWIGKLEPDSVYGDYAKAFEKVEAYIAAGDIYQANLTFPCKVRTAGHPLAIFAGLRQRARAGYGGVVWTGQDWLLSLSPELFFAAHDGKITTKPMKGTAARKQDVKADAAAVEGLRSDPKQRAENLMIVDLLRNDLSRVSERGSVEVPELFKVETYPTIHTMISTVTAKLLPSTGAAEILQAIFPCGSITGAPKIRAMEVIHEVEPRPRGIYTGSIGRVDDNGDAAFNVAIRTIHLRGGEAVGQIGLGSGVVADSKMEEEWRECLAKGRFVTDPRRFDLIETMRFEPDAGIAYLEHHLTRMKESARTFGFEFDRHATRNDLQSATFRLLEPRRIRLMLAPSGQIAVEITALPLVPVAPVMVELVPLPVAGSDFRLRHKTSDRRFYGAAEKQSGVFETVYVDDDGFITEGSFTNVFVERDGAYLTPPLARGLLPGILRTHLIETGRAVEGDLRAEDLVGGFSIGNASRGMIKARLLR